MSTFLSSNLKHLRLKSNKSQSDIGFQLKKAHTSIGNWEKGISEPSLSEIQAIARIFEISPTDFLFTDLSNVHLNEKKQVGKKDENVHLNVHPSVHLNAKTEMLGPGIHVGMPAVVTVSASGADNVVFVPVRARAGYLSGYADPEFISTLTACSVPGLHHGTFRAFEVEGASMFTTLHDHDVVVCRWATSADCRDDRVYVLVTRNDGILVKRCIFRNAQVIAKSDNNHRGEYPTIVHDLSEVAELWYVVQRWTRQLSPPGELFRRVIDLEADMALLKARLNDT